MKILEAIKNDEEVQQFRQEWKEKFSSPFPSWNYDCFGGIEEYKRRIHEALSSCDPKKICETCTVQTCKNLMGGGSV